MYISSEYTTVVMELMCIWHDFMDSAVIFVVAMSMYTMSSWTSNNLSANHRISNRVLTILLATDECM